MVKTGHWGFPGKAKFAGRVATLCHGTSQKTYEAEAVSYPLLVFRPLRVMGGAFVAEKRLRHPDWVPQPSFFRRNRL